jgi:ribonucleoside-triphosphate reductase
MITKIKKRDGREVIWNAQKVTDAIYKAAQAVGGSDYAESERLALEVSEIAEGRYSGVLPSVEDIQDIVEKVLIEKGHAKTAKAYILYRAERSRNRELDNQLMKIFQDITFKSATESDIKRENANIDGNTAMGTMLKYGSESAKYFNQACVLKKEFSDAHGCGDIHIHDLDFLTLTTTCCQIDLIKLLSHGFSTGHGYLRPPKSIGSYAALACIAIQSNQNDQHGGQSVPNFEYAMAGGVAVTYQKLFAKNVVRFLTYISDKDAEIHAEQYVHSLNQKPCLSPTPTQIEDQIEKLTVYAHGETDKIHNCVIKFTEEETDKQTFQAMEALIHNLNTMNSRAGAQTPFSSINYGTDTSSEGRMVIRNILLANERGLGGGETPIFPIHIFKVKEGVNYNEGDPNYDLFKLALKVSAKRLYPNFSFLDAPYNLHYYKPGDWNSEVAYMGCRTRVIGNSYDPNNEVVAGRGNLSFTSINLPRIAINAITADEKEYGKADDHTIAEFFKGLDDVLELVAEQLLFRLKIQSAKTVRNYPFLMGQGIWLGSGDLKADDNIGEILKHGTLSVGFIGVAETLVALIGEHHGQSEKAKKLGLKIVTHIRDFCDNKTKETGLNYTCLATPAEGLSGRFVRIDAKKYGVIKGVTDRDYYTNSFHVPVYYKISAFDKIKTEAPYHALTNAGHISYVELDGDPLLNLSAFEKIIRFMKEAGIGYGSINHPVDRDPVCGYTGIIGDTCPYCGRTPGQHKKNTAVTQEILQSIGVSDCEDEPFERIRRITGYLVGSLDRFNNAKRAEEGDRVKHGSTGESAK